MRRRMLIGMMLVITAAGMVFAGGQTEEAAAGVKYTPVGTYPIVEEKIELTFLANQPVMVEDFNTNRFSLFLEEKTNIHINWEMVPQQARQEKLSLILASGDYPDVFYGMSVTTDQEATYGTEEGLLLPLNDLIDDYMPALQEAMAKSPGSRGIITSPDGNIYSLPLLTNCYHCSNSAKMWVYQPFLDALGLEAPETTEDFYNMLKAFKNDDPNGNGNADEIPLAGAVRGWNSQVDRFLMNAFIYSDLDTNIDANSESDLGFYLDDGVVKTSVTDPAFREGLRYLNKLYSEGLIYEGSFVQDSAQLTQVVESSDLPAVGAATGGWRGQFSSFDSERFQNFRAIAPLEGPAGVREAVNMLQTPQTGNLVMSKDIAYPQAVARWADYLYTTEGTLTLRQGFEGEAWRKPVAGEVGLNGKPGVWYQLRPWNDKDPQNDTWIGGGIFAETSDFRLGQVADLDVENYWAGDNIEMSLYEQTAELYKPYANVEKEIPPLKYTVDEQAEFSTVKVDFAKYLRQSVVKFIVGNISIDNDWDEYVANLEQLGLSDIIALRQMAYDRQYK